MSANPKFIRAWKRVAVWKKNPNYIDPQQPPTLKNIKIDNYLHGSIFPILGADKKHRRAYRDTLARLSLAAHRAGYGAHTARGRLLVSSSYRPAAEQRRLYNLYMSGMGALAAPPGSSMHEKGLAVDVPNVRLTYPLITECRKLRLIDDVPSEKWHLTNHGWGA